MNDTPASGERVQKYVFNLEIYRFAKKAAKLPHPPLPFLDALRSSRDLRGGGGLKSTPPPVLGWLRPPPVRGLKEGCHLLDT